MSDYTYASNAIASSLRVLEEYLRIEARSKNIHENGSFQIVLADRYQAAAFYVLLHNVEIVQGVYRQALPVELDENAHTVSFNNSITEASGKTGVLLDKWNVPKLIDFAVKMHKAQNVDGQKGRGDRVDPHGFLENILSDPVQIDPDFITPSGRRSR